MDYETGKWIERIEAKLDYIVEKIAEADKKEEKDEEQVD